MKRAREEVEEEEEHQGQAAPAPMAPSPARNPRPAAATPSGTNSPGPVVTMDDAVDMVLSVKFAFNRAKYYEFLHVVSQIDRIGVRGIVDYMKVLLCGRPDLKHQLNMFLPAQYKISIRDDDEQEEVPAANRRLKGSPAQRD